jgi:hypothetical protein
MRNSRKSSTHCWTLFLSGSPNGGAGWLLPFSFQFFTHRGLSGPAVLGCSVGFIYCSVLECGSLHRFPRRSVFETAPNLAAVASGQLDGAVEARWLFRVVLQVKPIDFLIRSHSSHVPPSNRLGKVLRKLDVIRCPRFPIDDDHNILG